MRRHLRVGPQQPAFASSRWYGEIVYLKAPSGNAATVDAVNQHWQEVRGTRLFPRRSDIDPVRIWSALPYLAIVAYEILPFRIQTCFVGAEVARHCPRPAEGRYLDQMEWPVEDFIEATRVHARVYHGRAPVYGLSRAATADGQRVFEWAVFPLSEDGHRITGAVSIDGGISILGRPPPAG